MARTRPRPVPRSAIWAADMQPNAPAAGLESAIAANTRRVRERIARACERAGRDPQTVRLVAVSKTFPVERVRAAAAAGLTDLGENRVQEALDKVAATADLPNLTWHLVGHLQSNKARRAAQAMGWLHALDSVALLQRVDRAAAAAGTRPRLLVQVDLAGERTKHGVPPDRIREILDAGADCQAACVEGLMLLPPWSADPEQTRPWFRRLRALRDTLLAGGVPAQRLRELSMGMSHDFEVAIEEGATVVRVGTAIFGPRQRP